MADTASASIGDITTEMQLKVAPSAARLQVKQAKSRRNKLSQRHWRAMKKRIAKLPQELQDEILDLTISFQPTQDNVVHITKKYKPPLGLQVSWYTRATFAKAYYSNTIFHFQTTKQHDLPTPLTAHHKNRNNTPDALCHAWLSSLVETERDMIQTIRLERFDIIGHELRLRFRDASVGDNYESSWAGFELRSDVLVFNIESEEKWYRCKRDIATESPPSKNLRERLRREQAVDPAPFSVSPADLARWRSDRQLELDREARCRPYQQTVMKGGGPVSGVLLKAALKLHRSDFQWGRLI